MASSFTFTESHGTSGAPTHADTGYLNLLSANIGSGSDTTTVPAANPITIPGAGSAYSYERWCRGHWTGTFTSISNLRFWKSAGSLGSGVAIKAGLKGDATYVTPIVTVSSYASSDVPTVQGSGLQPTYASNYSHYIVMQLVIGTTAGSGNIGSQTYSMGWDEV